MFKDDYGAFEITFEYKEPDNNHTYELRKYVNSPSIKKLGGMYSIYSQDTKRIKFYKSEYLRDRAYSKFVNEDIVKVVNNDGVDTNNKVIPNKRIDYMKMPNLVCLKSLDEKEYKEFIRIMNKISPKNLK